MSSPIRISFQCVRTEELTFSQRICLKILPDDGSDEKAGLTGRLTFDLPDDVVSPFPFLKGNVYSAEITLDPK